MDRRFSEIKNREIHELHNDNLYGFSRLTEEERRFLTEDLEKNPPSLEAVEDLENQERMDNEENNIVQSQKNLDITIEPYELGKTESEENVFSDAELYGNYITDDANDFVLEDDNDISLNKNEAHIDDSMYEAASKVRVSFDAIMSLSDANANILAGFSNFDSYVNAADEIKRGYFGAYAGAIKTHQSEENMVLNNKEVQLLHFISQHNPDLLEDAKLDIAEKTLNNYLEFHESRFISAIKDGSSEKSYFVQLDRNLDVPINGQLVHCSAGSYIETANKDNDNINVVSVEDFAKNYHNIEYSRDSIIMRDVTNKNIRYSLIEEGLTPSQCNDISEQCSVKSNVAFDLALAIDKRLKSMDILMAIYPSNSSEQNRLVIVELDREGSIKQELDTLPIEKSLDDVKAKEFLGIIRDLSEDKNNPHQNLYKTAFEACAYNIPLMDNLDKIEREYRFEAMCKKQFDLFKNGNGIPAYGKDKDKDKEPKSLKPAIKKNSLDISDRGI